jgi:hypothetical protein
LDQKNCGALFDYDETPEASKAVDEREATYIQNILSHFEQEDGYGNALFRLSRGFVIECNMKDMTFRSVNDERDVTTQLGLYEVSVLLKTAGINLPNV